ncbi:MAG: DNA-binding protein [Dechloromonas sp.]|nr:MAG: DNA-binding protein [Dechloromonas sp.]
MKTAEQVKTEFRQKGITITGWARSNGFTRLAVHRVLNGEAKCYRGKAHRIAVLLGLKNGDIVEV